MSTATWWEGLGGGPIVLLLAAVLAAGCGAAPAVRIPTASASPSASTTPLAPGVRVPVAEASPPTYTISTKYPLPSGVSAATVAQDVVIDNLIENVAIQRGDAALLSYADCGNWLAAEQRAITKNRLGRISVVSIHDQITELQLGYQPDPNNAAAVAAVIVAGQEVEVTTSGKGKAITLTSKFDVLQWLVLSPQAHRYLTCDSASS